MRRDGVEVTIGRHHDEVVSSAELRQESVDRSNLHAGPPAVVANVGRCDVVVAIRDQEGQGSEALDDRPFVPGPAEPLQSSWRTSPVEKTASPESSAWRSRSTAGRCGGRSRRKASDQTLVSTNRFTRASARPCSQLAVPLQRAEQFNEALLLAACHVLLECPDHDGGLGSLAAHLKGALQQPWVDVEVRGHVRTVAQSVAHGTGGPTDGGRRNQTPWNTSINGKVRPRSRQSAPNSSTPTICLPARASRLSHVTSGAPSASASARNAAS
jgi:hypothetical protein